MKVYTKILLWCFGTLVLSLVAFFGVSFYVSMRNVDHGNFVPRLNALLMDESIAAYESRGPSGLIAEIDRINRHLSGQHYLTDAAGNFTVARPSRPVVTTPDHRATVLIGVTVSRSQPSSSPPKLMLTGAPRFGSSRRP